MTLTFENLQNPPGQNLIWKEFWLILLYYLLYLANSSSLIYESWPQGPFFGEDPGWDKSLCSTSYLLYKVTKWDSSSE